MSTGIFIVIQNLKCLYWLSVCRPTFLLAFSHQWPFKKSVLKICDFSLPAPYVDPAAPKFPRRWSLTTSIHFAIYLSKLNHPHTPSVLFIYLFVISAGDMTQVRHYVLEFTFNCQEVLVADVPTWWNYIKLHRGVVEIVLVGVHKRKSHTPTKDTSTVSLYNYGHPITLSCICLLQYRVYWRGLLDVCTSTGNNTLLI